MIADKKAGKGSLSRPRPQEILENNYGHLQSQTPWQQAAIHIAAKTNGKDEVMSGPVKQRGLERDRKED